MVNGRQILLSTIMASLIGVAMILPACRAAPAPAPAPIKLMFTHFEPPAGADASAFLEFGKELEAKTGGRVKVEFALGGTLGPTPEQYDLVARGMADMGDHGAPYTPGRFPTLTIAELPVRAPSAETATKAWMELMKKGYFDKDFPDTKLLAVHSTAPIQLFLAKERISSLTDLKGKKIRAPTPFWLTMSVKLGLVPIGMPVTEAYGAMEKGIVDATWIPYSAIADFKLDEVTKYIVTIDIIYFPFVTVMNKAYYDKLPEDIKATVRELTEKYAYVAAQNHDTFSKRAKEQFEKRAGREILAFSEADWATLKKLLTPTWDEWITTMEGKGFPTKKALDDLESSFKKLGIAAPFIR